MTELQNESVKKLQVMYFKKKIEIDEHEAELKLIHEAINKKFIDEGIEKDECPLGKFGFRNTKKYSFLAPDIEVMDDKKADLKSFKKSAEDRAEVVVTKTLIGVKNSK